MGRRLRQPFTCKRVKADTHEAFVASCPWTMILSHRPAPLSLSVRSYAQQYEPQLPTISHFLPVLLAKIYVKEGTLVSKQNNTNAVTRTHHRAD